MLEDRLAPAISLNPNTWTNIGPQPIANGQVPGQGAVSGRVTGIAVDTGNPATNASDPNTNPIFIATAGGGVWKSIDAGTTWTALTDNLNDSANNPITEFMGAIAETRDGAGNEIIYAGTGEGNGSDSVAGEGILVSQNGGKTWTLTAQDQNTFQGLAISQIAIDPQNSQVAWAAVSSQTSGNGHFGAVSQTGIYQTNNGGMKWNLVFSLPAVASTSVSWTSIVVDPATTGNKAILFASAGINGAATDNVYESTDGGMKWASVGTGVDAVQTVTLNGNITGGSFTLTLNGKMTVAINWNNTASTLNQNIQNALDTLLGKGNTLVTSTSSSVFTVTFVGSMAATVVNTTANSTGLTGVAPSVSVANTAIGASGNGLPSGATVGRIALAIADPSGAKAATLYASIATAIPGTQSTLLALEKSTDGGSTWANITANLTGDNYLGSQGSYDNVVAIDPNNPSEVYVAGVLQHQGYDINKRYDGIFTGGGILESTDGRST
jgi:hypothetical protein